MNYWPKTMHTGMPFGLTTPIRPGLSDNLSKEGYKGWRGEVLYLAKTYKYITTPHINKHSHTPLVGRIERKMKYEKSKEENEISCKGHVAQVVS